MPSHSFSIKGAVGNETTGGGDYYDGPMPARGTYTGKLKILKVGKLSERSKTPGAPRLQILVEITGPKNAKNVKGSSCIGAGVWGGLNVTEQGVPYVNQFLNALTDGSEKSKLAIQKAFWEKPIVTDDEDHVTKIGRLLVNSPNGELPIGITVKHSTYQGELQAQIGRYLSIKKKSDDSDDEDADDADEDEDADDDPDLEDADEDDDDGDDPY